MSAPLWTLDALKAATGGRLAGPALGEHFRRRHR